MLWVRIPLRQGVLDTTLCDTVSLCQWLMTGRWFSTGTLVSSTEKTYRHDIYNWNIVESGVKHHKLSKKREKKTFIVHVCIISQ